jgi:hypothetical protein
MNRPDVEEALIIAPSIVLYKRKLRANCIERAIKADRDHKKWNLDKEPSPAIIEKDIAVAINAQTDCIGTKNQTSRYRMEIIDAVIQGIYKEISGPKFAIVVLRAIDITPSKSTFPVLLKRVSCHKEKSSSTDSSASVTDFIGPTGVICGRLALN